MTASINVNLKRCDCSRPTDGFQRVHLPTCASTPVLIPCPIRRSVTFGVRIGECAVDGHHLGGCYRITNTHGQKSDVIHITGCPAKPIRVSCSISGKTWEESEVFDMESPSGHPDILRLCYERWALVKALVTGQRHDLTIRFKTWCDLVDQRDAVFSALADMARAEVAALEAQARVMGAAGWKGIHFADPQHHDDKRPSASFLARYVERLIEQVGVLP